MLLQAALHFNLPNATDPLKRFTDTLYITQVKNTTHRGVQFSFLEGTLLAGVAEESLYFMTKTNLHPHSVCS